MNAMKAWIMCMFMVAVCINCSNSHEGKGNLPSENSQPTAYHRFVSEGLVLSTETLNVASTKQVLIVELPEIPSSGYLWHYKVSAPDTVSLIEDRSFGPDSPGVYGDTQQHLWKFKALRTGSNTIVFKKYRDFIGEKGTTEEYMFNIKIN